MRFAVLVSGSGSNLQALIDADNSGRLAPAEIALVISNRPGVYALDRAKAAGVPALVIDHREHSDRASFERALIAALDAHGVEAVVLAGFMRVLTEEFVSRYPLRILNTHPALCPAFPGIAAANQALEHGVKITGCTVHFVDLGVDTGPIVFQAAVPIEDDDTAEALQARIQAHEHVLLPRAVHALAAGKLSVAGRRVTVAEEPG